MRSLAVVLTEPGLAQLPCPQSRHVAACSRFTDPRFDKPPRAVWIDDFLGRGSVAELIDHAAQGEGRDWIHGPSRRFMKNWYWSGRASRACTVYAVN